MVYPRGKEPAPFSPDNSEADFSEAYSYEGHGSGESGAREVTVVGIVVVPRPIAVDVAEVGGGVNRTEPPVVGRTPGVL